jgi:hypothetical protein
MLAHVVWSEVWRTVIVIEEFRKNFARIVFTRIVTEKHYACISGN